MTRETEKAFVIIYSEYLRRRSYKTVKCEAIRFDLPKVMAIEAFSCWNPEDIRYCLRELHKLGYVSIDIFGNVELQEIGIAYMESKPKEYFGAFTHVVNDLLSVISVLRPG